MAWAAGPGRFEPALLDLVGACRGRGRASTSSPAAWSGARQGWVEARLSRAVPCAPLGADRTCQRRPSGDPRLRCGSCPGLSQAAPADVMRGEETQIAGFLALNPGFDGVLCLPGTHTKWVRVSAGEVVSFQTFMTGELFALLGAHRCCATRVAGEGWDEAAFADAVDDAMSRPETAGGAAVLAARGGAAARACRRRGARAGFRGC